MVIPARYLHTNLTVRDFDGMLRFYREVFGCEPVRDPQTIDAQWVERITGIAGARLTYVHLRFPGSEVELEINAYDNPMRSHAVGADQLGFGHVSFAVDDVQAALDAVRAAGGGALGDPVTAEVPGRGTLTEVYATDPEGNIIELQHYAR
jgi:catechol 2,3-dioxygenase-like lactoylglutathione lyase family enzyme